MWGGIFRSPRHQRGVRLQHGSGPHQGYPGRAALGEGSEGHGSGEGERDRHPRTASGSWPGGRRASEWTVVPRMVPAAQAPSSRGLRGSPGPSAPARTRGAPALLPDIAPLRGQTGSIKHPNRQTLNSIKRVPGKEDLSSLPEGPSETSAQALSAVCRPRPGLTHQRDRGGKRSSLRSQFPAHPADSGLTPQGRPLPSSSPARPGQYPFLRDQSRQPGCREDTLAGGRGGAEWGGAGGHQGRPLTPPSPGDSAPSIWAPGTRSLLSL